MKTNKESLIPDLSKKVITIEQIISVQVSNGPSGTLFSNGITALKDAFFTSIHPVNSDKINYITGIAPDKGSETFMILEYISKKVMMNNPIELHLINRDCKILIEKGRIMIELEQTDGTRAYSIIGEEIGFWEIITKQVSKEISTKIDLFKNASRIYIENVGSIELLSEERMERKYGSTYMEPLVRTFNNNPLFAKFVKEYCNGDIRVTNVCKSLCKYLEDEKIKANIFTRRMKEGSVALFYNVATIKNLHPKLKPLLNITRSVARETGAERMTIDIGAMIARIPVEHQIKVWNQIKGLASQPLMSATIAKMKRELNL